MVYHNQTADISIENISKEIFECILIDVTVVIASIHFNQQFNKHTIYNEVGFKDNDNRNLVASNLVLIH
jgi:hypothetical protein